MLFLLSTEIRYNCKHSVNEYHVYGTIFVYPKSKQKR